MAYSLLCIFAGQGSFSRYVIEFRQAASLVFLGAEASMLRSCCWVQKYHMELAFSVLYYESDYTNTQ
jgi:hypothetical protein